MTSVLILTLDHIGPKMAGPAIRALEMARSLSRTNDVELLASSVSLDGSGSFTIRELSKSHLAQGLERADTVVFQGFVFHLYPEIAASGKALVCDLYDPLHLESLEMNRAAGWERRVALAVSDLEAVNEQLRAADFFICASEKQRDFWLGQLTGLGRVNPLNYDLDRSLRALIDVVPFGIPAKPPTLRQEQGSIKGKVQGISPGDNVLIWGGGIYNWFDPLTLINAVDRVRSTHPRIRLFFMGSGHPNPEVPKMHMAGQASELARSLGILGTHVFFNESWVPYDERAGYLLDADIGVSCHFDHIETAFSYRTRVLDYLWAGLPVIVTEGDQLAMLVKDSGLGMTVGAEDVGGLARAITRMIDDQEFVQRCRQQVSSLRPTLTWDVATVPLVQFCSDPRKAADNERPDWRPSHRKSMNPFRLAGRVGHYWRSGGWESVRVHTRKYLSKMRGT